jgi:hypothetical protein
VNQSLTTKARSRYPEPPTNQFLSMLQCLEVKPGQASVIGAETRLLLA